MNEFIIELIRREKSVNLALCEITQEVQVVMVNTEVQELEIFIAVVKGGSFTKAAEE